jgi:hypothetical protein
MCNGATDAQTKMAYASACRSGLQTAAMQPGAPAACL